MRNAITAFVRTLLVAACTIQVVLGTAFVVGGDVWRRRYSETELMSRDDTTTALAVLNDDTQDLDSRRRRSISKLLACDETIILSLQQGMRDAVDDLPLVAGILISGPVLLASVLIISRKTRT